VVSLALSGHADEPVTSWPALEPAERRYAMRLARQRLHQAMSPERVVDAYGGRCALRNLPALRLLEAADIVPDGAEALGQPDDAGLIAVDPDCCVHVAGIPLAMHDGPMLDGMKSLKGTLIRLPADKQFRPDQNHLALRFASFDPSR
jgi:putative restriction endonuclease